MIITFNESDLRKKLEGLLPPFRVLFSAACAERRLGKIRTGMGGEAYVLGCAMDYLWHELGTGIFDSRHLQEELSRCLVFGDTDWEGSAACVAYAIRTRLTSDSQEAVWAARSAYEDLDYEVMNKLNVDLNKPGVESVILADEKIQSELLRQLRDLAECKKAENSPQDFAEVVSKFQNLAKEEANGA